MWWIKFVGFLYLILIWTRIPKLWSKLYRKIWQRKYNKVKLDTNLSLKEVNEKLSRLTWIKDGWKELWDAIGSPKHVQKEIIRLESGSPQSGEALDCDDFSCWAANCINYHKYDPILLSVSWAVVDYDNKPWYVKLFKPFTQFTGHMVCVVWDQDEEKLKHVSNWGISNSYDDLPALIEGILKQVGGTFVCASTYTKDLNLINVSTDINNMDYFKIFRWF